MLLPDLDSCGGIYVVTYNVTGNPFYPYAVPHHSVIAGSSDLMCSYISR